MHQRWRDGDRWWGKREKERERKRERETETDRERALVKMMARASHRDPESKCTGVASGVNE